jgi:hypothetical protein
VRDWAPPWCWAGWAFYVINYAASGRFPGGLVPAFAIPGVLFLIYAAGDRVKSGP